MLQFCSWLKNSAIRFKINILSFYVPISLQQMYTIQCYALQRIFICFYEFNQPEFSKWYIMNIVAGLSWAIKLLGCSRDRLGSLDNHFLTFGIWGNFTFEGGGEWNSFIKKDVVAPRGLTWRLHRRCFLFSIMPWVVSTLFGNCQYLVESTSQILMSPIDVTFFMFFRAAYNWDFYVSYG